MSKLNCITHQKRPSLVAPTASGVSSYHRAQILLRPNTHTHIIVHICVRIRTAFFLVFRAKKHKMRTQACSRHGTRRIGRWLEALERTCVHDEAGICGNCFWCAPVAHNRTTLHTAHVMLCRRARATVHMCWQHVYR